MVTKKPKIVIVGVSIAGLSATQQLCGAGRDMFEVVVVEAGSRASGRVFTSEFAGHRVEMGATWVQGVVGSPVYTLAHDAGTLQDDAADLPYERMDGGFPDRVLTVAEGGKVVDADTVAKPIEELYRSMMDAARAGMAGGRGGDMEEYLRQGLQAYQAARPSGSKELEEVENALLAMHINWECTNTSADDLSDLDLAAEGKYRDFPGDHVTILGGYTRVVEHLVAALPPGTLRLGLRLRRIDWSETPVRLHFADGATTLSADHVILTVLLGVLKASIGKDVSTPGAIAFDPPLPHFKREAISCLVFGVVNKLFIEVEAIEATELEDGEEHLARAAPPAFSFLHMAFLGHVAKILWSMRGTESICPVHESSSVVLTWFAGREAAHLESLPDDDAIRAVHATLDSFLPAPPRSRSSGAAVRGTSRWRVKRIKRTGWATDPLFLGSYSYVAIGSSGEDLDRMVEPLPRGLGADRTPPRLLLTGEATHRMHYSTTHASYLSGIREANRLLQHYRRDQLSHIFL